MPWWVRACIALTENSGPIPRTPIRHFLTALRFKGENWVCVTASGPKWWSRLSRLQLGDKLGKLFMKQFDLKYKLWKHRDSAWGGSVTEAHGFESSCASEPLGKRTKSNSSKQNTKQANELRCLHSSQCGYKFLNPTLSVQHSSEASPKAFCCCCCTELCFYFKCL